MKRIGCIVIIICGLWSAYAQEVSVDGRLQPLLDQFFELCEQYDIDYHDKLFQLERIDIVNTLTVKEHGTTLGMLRRDDQGRAVAIDINWMAQIDPEILKVVAFHEFGHYFLEYSSHVCDDCGKIMAIVNSSYFDIARNWDEQVKVLFEESPILLRKFGKALSVSRPHVH
ncbi:MAG: hypothetical protein AAF466_06470 [Bacteroidota bacterium]